MGYDQELDKAQANYYRRSEDVAAWIEANEEELVEEYSEKHEIEEAKEDWPIEEVARFTEWAKDKFREEQRGVI